MVNAMVVNCLLQRQLFCSEFERGNLLPASSENVYAWVAMRAQRVEAHYSRTDQSALGAGGTERANEDDGLQMHRKLFVGGPEIAHRGRADHGSKRVAQMMRSEGGPIKALRERAILLFL